MTREVVGDSDNDRGHSKASAAELQPVSRETLALLLEATRMRYQKMQSLGEDSFECLSESGKQYKIRMCCHDDDEGRMERDFDGTLQEDTTGRYKYFSPGWYIDTSIQASIFKIEEAEEPELDGQGFITTHTISELDQMLDIKKHVGPAERARWSVLGEPPMFDDEPPLITIEDHNARMRQEDALGVSLISESEATDLLRLLQAV